MGIRAVAKVALFVSGAALILSGCQSSTMSCESYQDSYDAQMEKFAFYAALVEGFEAGDATTNNPDHDSAVESRRSLLASAGEVADRAAADGCFVKEVTLD